LALAIQVKNIKMNIDQTLLGALNRIVQVLTDNRVAIGFETISVSSTAIPLTTVPSGATSALITVNSNSIRYTLSGTTLSTTVGHLKAATTEFTITTAQNLSQARFIAAASDASITVTYFK